jgi:glutamine synthetase
MRTSWDAIIGACEAMGAPGKPQEHLAGYGVGTEDRLTGAHETAHWSTFKYGVSDRGASIRIPWQVAKDKKGYLEDRRPNANMDPYVVARLITNTVCSAEVERGAKPAKAPAKKVAKKK